MLFPLAPEGGSDIYLVMVSISGTLRWVTSCWVVLSLCPLGWVNGLGIGTGGTVCSLLVTAWYIVLVLELVLVDLSSGGLVLVALVYELLLWTLLLLGEALLSVGRRFAGVEGPPCIRDASQSIRRVGGGAIVANCGLFASRGPFALLLIQLWLIRELGPFPVSPLAEGCLFWAVLTLPELKKLGLSLRWPFRYRLYMMGWRYLSKRLVRCRLL